MTTCAYCDQPKAGLAKGRRIPVCQAHITTAPPKVDQILAVLKYHAYPNRYGTNP